MKEKTLTIVHLVFILFAYTSPFWLDWRLVVLGSIIYWAQLLILKACVVSIAQYGDTETSFVAVGINRFMKKTFSKELSTKKMKHFLDWLPLFFSVLAIILQEYFGLIPFIKI